MIMGGGGGTPQEPVIDNISTYLRHILLQHYTLRRNDVLAGLLSSIHGIFWLLFIISFDTYKREGAHLWNQYFFRYQG
jgi:hypothetical protein